MAVEIPVVIDIDQAFEDAAKRVNAAMKPLQDKLSSDALLLRFKVDDKTTMSVKKLLDGSSASAKQLKTALKDVEARIAKMQSAGGFMPGKLTTQERDLLNIYTQLQMKIKGAGDAVKMFDKDMRTSLNSAKRAGKETADAYSNVNFAMDKTNSKLATLIKNSMRLIALHAARNFIRNVREVTSEFEMQRVALAGIIQDTAQAEALFKQIKAAAIKSPFEIKDLVTYTKQLSAYRIETDKLFDVTMQLADVSAGLGVDMNRLVLAYGQVRAAAVLRGQELRQFTEAGIPLVELLAEKFTQLNGRVTTTADVFELISKRAVSFSMIEEIFNDMTESGGMFYKMQEKQSETLKGQWMKLRDALSIMYDEIGNTSSVHNAMERLMADAMSLMQNWRLIAGSVKAVAAQFALLKLASLFMPNLAKNITLAQRATDAFARSQAAASMAEKTGSASFVRSAERYKKMGTYLEKASLSANGFSRNWNKMKASMVSGGWIGIVITALTALIGYLVTARIEAERLGKELSQNIAKGNLQIEQAERNFKRLADAAITAADGSSEQREALKELQRTYGDVLPAQDLQIDRLKKLKDNYDVLTDAIREKIEMQIHEQNVNQITESYGTSLGTQRKGLEKFLKKEAGYTTEEATRIIAGVNDAIKDGLLTVKKDFFETAKIIEDIIKEQTGADAKPGIGQAFQQAQAFFSTRTYYKKLLIETQKFNTSLEEEEARFGALDNKMGIYSERLKQIREDLKKAPEGFTLEEAGSFEYNQARWKQAVKRYKLELKRAFYGVNIEDAFGVDDFIDFGKIISKLEEDTKFDTDKLKPFVEALQKDYLKIAPQDSTTRLVTEAANRFADAVGISMTKVQGYLKQDETSMEDYAKSVEDFVKGQKERLKELTFLQENFRQGVSDYVRPTNEDIKKEKDELNFLEKLLDFVKEFLKQKSGSSYKEDPWILIYKNRIKFVQDFNKGVQDMNKFMSENNAIAKEREIMEGRGLALGFNGTDNLDVRNMTGSRQEMLDWYDDTIEQIKKKIAELGGSTWSNLGVQAILAKDTKNRTLKAWQDLLADVFKERTDFDLSQQKKDLEDALKRMADEIKQSETARNFYQNILDLSGDEDLAATMAVSVYGGIGEDFKDRLQEQLNKALESLDMSKVPDDIASQLKEAFSTQDFETILKYLHLFPEEWQKLLKDMATDNQKYNADIANDLLKSLKNAKTYSEQRVELAMQTAKRIKQIEEMNVPEDTKDQLRKQNAKKEAEDAAKLAYDAFKETPMYVELFANLDQASTKMLRNMRENLLAMKSEWKDLHPRELKELQSRLDELDKQLATKNPFRALTDSFKEYFNLTRQMSRRQADMESVTATKSAEEEKAALELRTHEYEVAVKTFGADSENAKMAKRRMNDQKVITDKAIEEAEAAQNTAIAYRLAAKHIEDAANALQEWAGYVDTSLDGIKKIVDTFASNDVSDTFNILSDGISKTLGGAAKSASGIARIVAGDLSAIPDVISGIGDVISGIFGTKKALEIKKINKQIEEQARLVEDLEYSYGRLEKAIAKAFGSDYIYNYNKQLENLMATQAAYEEQARLESEKGKKADQDKIRDYENSARDTADQIADMRGQLAEFFAGTDIASAAKDFANSWIEAYKEFGSTTDAMKERFQELIQSMIEQSLGAKIMQTILQPLFDSIDELAQTGGELTAQEIAQIAQAAPEYVDKINEAMTGLMNEMQAAGYNVRQGIGQFTGISRDIAGASEESINGLAAGINTQNFYMSLISQNVASILMAMTGESVQGATGATAPDPYKETMLEYVGSIPQMRDDMNAIRTMLERVIRPVGTSSTHYVSVRL